MANNEPQEKTTSPLQPEFEEEDDAPLKTFAELGICKELVEASSTLGWLTATKIQAESIPYALEGRDVIGLAETGSGKTGAFVLPILQALLENQHPFFACVLSPTRELAFQIAQQFEALGSGIGVKCAALVGGVNMMDQVVSLAKRPHIVVASPGRLLDHLTNTKGFSLHKLKFLVLDEADKLLNSEFEKSIDEILNVIPKERRTFLFSATMTKKVKKLQRACLRNPVKIESALKYGTVKTLRQEYCFVPAKHKDCYLVYMLHMYEKSVDDDKLCLVFTRTCDSTMILAQLLCNLRFKAIAINGHMSQDKRLGALNRFKSKQSKILVCTDVMSRGLDIPEVDFVINYDIPMNSKDYIHRVGRTARSGKTGYAVSLVTQYDVEWYKIIENLLGKELPAYQVEQAEALVFLESVSDAKRNALSKLREKAGGKRRRRNADDDEEEEEEVITTKGKRSKASSKSKRR